MGKKRGPALSVLANLSDNNSLAGWPLPRVKGTLSR